MIGIIEDSPDVNPFQGSVRTHEIAVVHVGVEVAEEVSTDKGSSPHAHSSSVDLQNQICDSRIVHVQVNKNRIL